MFNNSNGNVQNLGQIKILMIASRAECHSPPRFSAAAVNGKKLALRVSLVSGVIAPNRTSRQRHETRL